MWPSSFWWWGSDYFSIHIKMMRMAGHLKSQTLSSKLVARVTNKPTSLHIALGGTACQSIRENSAWCVATPAYDKNMFKSSTAHAATTNMEQLILMTKNRCICLKNSIYHFCPKYHELTICATICSPLSLKMIIHQVIFNWATQFTLHQFHFNSMVGRIQEHSTCSIGPVPSPGRQDLAEPTVMVTAMVEVQ